MIRIKKVLLTATLLSCLCGTAAAQSKEIPRTAEGKPNLQGIWQAATRAGYDLEDHPSRLGMPAGRSVVESGKIPYKAEAAAQKLQNHVNRATADPLGKCFMPGVPRIMYLEHPYHIFQTPEQIAITFEWSSVHRLIYVTGEKPKYDGVESWMGHSRARWEGDTLVVEVRDFNDRSWLDMAGNFHSDAMKVTERYTMLDADTIEYGATIEDAKVFEKPWTLKVPLVRQKQMDRVLEYACQAEVEEANGAFERDPRTWYRDPGAPASPLGEPAKMGAAGPLAAIATGANLQRNADKTPKISGNYAANGGGANYGLEQHPADGMTPASRGVIVDPADGKLPTQAWARAERIDRELPHRGYDDPTAHCFVYAGVPRSIYVPSPIQILQPPGYVVILFERMAWRVIPLDGRAHIPDNIRLWQGDSVGHWEGDVLVVETTNLNGRAWLNEVGEVLTHAATVVERFYPVSAQRLLYRATVTDPLAYTKPWTIEMQLNKQDDELLEVACHEDNHDLEHLRDVRDEFRAQKKEK